MKLFLVPDMLCFGGLPIPVYADDCVQAYQRLAHERGWPDPPKQTMYSQRVSDNCAEHHIPRPPEIHPAYDFVVEISQYQVGVLSRAYQLQEEK